MKQRTSSRVKHIRAIMSSLTSLLMDTTGSCSECQKSLFACDKHAAITRTYNLAYDALSDIEYEVEKME